MMLADNKTRVGTLRLRTNPSEAGAVRLAVANQLQTAELRPAALPPAAILVVRRVVDPLPRCVSSQSGNARVDRRWEAAARDALAVAYRQAARPAREAVPANATAVLFDDDAEMLACLALDVSRGQAPERWWWRTLPPAWTTARPESLQAIFCDRPASVPAALHRLAERGEVWSVVGYLRRPQLERVLAAVSWAFGLPRIEFEGGASLRGPRRVGALPRDVFGTGELVTAETETEPSAVSSGESAVTPSPWESWLPAAVVPPTAAREAVCLIGVALGLFRAPTVARRPSFAAAAQTWLDVPPAVALSHLREDSAPVRARRSSPSPSLSPAALGKDDGTDVPAGPADGRTHSRHAEDALVGPEKGSRSDEAGHDASSTDQPVTPVVARPERSATGGNRLASEPAVWVRSTVAEEHWAEDESPVPPVDRVQNPADLPSPTPSPPISEGPTRPRKSTRDVARLVYDEAMRIPALNGGVTTRLGGVLYLINLMVHLDLPACFEADWELESRVGPWGVLELLGRALIRRDTAALHDDPIWTALAALDHRSEGTLPRAPRRPTTAPALPAGWLDQTEDSTRKRRGKLAWTVSELRAASPLLEPVSTPALEWLGLVVPYVRSRLHRSLAVGSTRRLNLDTTLLRRTGRLYRSDLHVDLVIPLDDVSIAVRVAGLDVDPGWLPGFGRVVKFHYE